MFALFYIISVYFVLLAQTSLFGPLAVAGGQPDLCLIFTMYLSLYWNLNRSLAAIITLGLFQDALGGGLVGFNLLSKVLYAILLSLVQRHLRGAAWVTQIVIAMLVSLVDGFFYFTLSSAVSPTNLGVAQAAPVLLVTIFYTGLLAPFVILVLEWLRSIFRLTPDVVSMSGRMRPAFL